VSHEIYEFVRVITICLSVVATVAGLVVVRALFAQKTQERHRPEHEKVRNPKARVFELAGVGGIRPAETNDLSFDVTVRNRWSGESVTGRALLSKDRTKTTVSVYFHLPLHIEVGDDWRVSYGEEFRLKTGARVLWGQGLDEDMNDWFLDGPDCQKILDGGGG
jgi:hypothetical protein